MRYFLGADLGGSKTHTVIADETGRVVGFGHSGPGNHQSIGFEGMWHSVSQGLDQALTAAGLTTEAISGAAFSIAGYDWPSEKPAMAAVIDRLCLPCSYQMVNDTIGGLVAGAEEGWGVVLVSGTGCNCRGLDRDHRREGRVTGYGYHLGEFAGATELVWRAMQQVANEWTRRGPATALTAAFIRYAGAKDLADLIEGYTEQRYQVDAPAAPLVFEVARQGDPVACELIRWAGVELAEMAKAVIRQLGFEQLEFEVVLSGSMFDGGPLLIDPLWETISHFARGARLVRLTERPVIGAVMLGMEMGGLRPTPTIRQNLADSLRAFTPPIQT
jgi:N-acetylglucosamine kinase-like BadF-type ATPase